MFEFESLICRSLLIKLILDVLVFFLIELLGYKELLILIEFEGC